MTTRVCAQPGCPTLVERGRCDAHRIPRVARYMPPSASRNHAGVSPSRRGHGYEYQRARAALLADGPRCAWGCGRKATTADYAVPWSQGGTLADLLPSCAPCNYARGARLRAQGGSNPQRAEACTALQVGPSRVERATASGHGHER
jgi:hypothetical protein